jgi:hypothetical protein
MIRNLPGISHSDPASIVPIVLSRAEDLCRSEECTLADDLEACATAAVARYHGSRVRTFIPLLALRDVRLCIEAGRCPVPATGNAKEHQA